MAIGTYGITRPADVSINDIDMYYNYMPNRQTNNDMMFRLNASDLLSYTTLPEDLKLAVLDLVEYYMKNNSAVHVNRDVTPNVTQINYVTTSNFPAHIKRVLDQYVADYT